MKGGRAPCAEEGTVISIHLAPLARAADRLGDAVVKGVRARRAGYRVVQEGGDSVT